MSIHNQAKIAVCAKIFSVLMGKLKRVKRQMRNRQIRSSSFACRRRCGETSGLMELVKLRSMNPNSAVEGTCSEVKLETDRGAQQGILLLDNMWCKDI